MDNIEGLKHANVVIIVKGDHYAEVVKKEGDDLTLMGWNRYYNESAAKLETDGFKAVPAMRIIKANGTWMYAVNNDGHTDWYISGHCHAAIKGKKK